MLRNVKHQYVYRADVKPGLEKGTRHGVWGRKEKSHRRENFRLRRCVIRRGKIVHKFQTMHANTSQITAVCIFGVNLSRSLC